MRISNFLTPVYNTENIFHIFFRKLLSFCLFLVEQRYTDEPVTIAIESKKRNNNKPTDRTINYVR